ncbi:MAG: DUF3040 domain-containing protein [Streptosporangiales bacterium]|nr:DUF3040 domain-containing protein [Streptosporangiales bacterium]MBO0892305.1 DUF3040 domain-containing protein [Acidothermales bacterium]
MPLSEHEQRELEQIERYLAAEDPKFVSSIRNITPRSRYRRRMVLACIGFLLGVGLLLFGVQSAVLVSIAGFVLMLLSLGWFVSSVMHMHGGDRSNEQQQQQQQTRETPGVVSLQQTRRQRKRKGGTSQPHAKSGFMDRIEARWLRRRDRPWY